MEPSCEWSRNVTFCLRLSSYHLVCFFVVSPHSLKLRDASLFSQRDKGDDDMNWNFSFMKTQKCEYKIYGKNVFLWMIGACWGLQKVVNDSSHCFTLSLIALGALSKALSKQIQVLFSCVCQEINIKPVWKSNPRGRKQHKASRVEFWALSSSSLLFALLPILVDPVHAVKVDRVYMREMALFRHEQRVTWWIIKRSNQIFMMFLFSRLARSVCLFIFMNWTLFIGDISIDRSSH